MLSSGSNVRDLWLDVIEGRKHPLHHGYYCTRQPDDDERSNNITPMQARHAEANFFLGTAPWSTSTHRDRFETNNLVSTLSTLLVQIINDRCSVPLAFQGRRLFRIYRLPFIRQTANECMDACRRELASLPDKIVGEPATHMLNLITAFCTVIRGFVGGESDMSALIHERNAAFVAFQEAIKNTQPRFVARIPGEAGTYSTYFDSKPPQNAPDLIATQKSVFLTDIRSHITK
jgi:hypothetical protein